MKKTSQKVLSLALAAAMTLPLGMVASTAAEGEGMNVSYYKMADNYGGILGGGGFTQDYTVATTKQFDASIDTLMFRSYAWGSEEQVNAINTAPGGDDYLVHWTGTLTAKTAGTYQICGHRIDNGFLMKVDGNKVYEYWGDHWGDNGACMTDSTTFTLAEGESVEVEMWFLELGGGEALDIFAKNADDVEANINDAFTLDLTKQVYMHRDGNGYINDYLGNGNGAWGEGNGGNGGQCEPANQKFDISLIEEDWMEPWTDGMPSTVTSFSEAIKDANSYVIKYTGSMTPKESGTYTFGANVIDNGFYLEIGEAQNVAYEFWTGRTWNDDGSGNTQPSQLVLEAGKAYNFTAYFLETDGGQALDLVCSVNGGDRVSVNDAFTFSTAAAESDNSILYDFTTIDSVDEFVAFAKAANAAGRSFMAKQTIKVTTDLDMAGVDFTPIADGLFVLDFDGHTVSNLHRTVNTSDHVYAGLIADKMANDNFNSAIINLVLKDSSITVNTTEEWNYACVGAVIGMADRAYIDNITLENITINVSGNGAIGGIIGHKDWACGHPQINASINNLTVNAPNAQGIGMFIGRMGGDSEAYIQKVSVTNTTVSTHGEYPGAYVGLTDGQSINVDPQYDKVEDYYINNNDGTTSITFITEPGCAITGNHAEGHRYVVREIIATCTEGGYSGDIICSDCFNTIETGSETPVDPDNHGEAVVDEDSAVAPTETEAGKEADKVCPDCGEVLEEGAVIPATGTGDDNTGDDNTGDDNTGDDNTGDDNTGDDNTDNGNTDNGNTDNGNTDNGNTDNGNTDNGKPAKTGDATLVAVALAVVAIAGAAVVSKKRHSAE